MILFEAAPPPEIFHWPDHPTLLIKTMFLKSVVHEPPAPEFPVWKWGLLGGVRAGDLQSAAPAGGAPAQHREVRTRAPAAPVPSSASTWGGDRTPQGEPRPQSMAPKPPSPTLKPLFLSELSDLRPSRLRLGEA